MSTITIKGRTWEFEHSHVEPRWKFGEGQTRVEEDSEILAAKRAGYAEFYLRGQRGSRLIHEEMERRAR